MKTNLKSVFLALAMISAMITNAQVPKLSSYPSAAATIFLDFDGHTVNGTSWNTSGPIYCGGSGLTDVQINEIFNRVAEDYRPFNLNVTTDSAKFLAAPIAQRSRVILTVSSSWYGSAGGVSFVGSFTWGDDTPAFVFSALLSYNTKNIAEAASHEAGHTLGLYHQSVYNASCVKTAEYNPGTGTGEIGWAPIMGVGYYQNMTLWNIGPNPFGCANTQSDLSVITSYNGFGFRTDDYANTFAAATNKTFSSNAFTINGVVEQNTDGDMFKFTVPAIGRFQMNAIPFSVGSSNSGSDLDLQVTLFNSAQTALSVFNPGTTLNLFVDTTLNAGTYYVKVEGRGNAYAPNYASLGSYAIQAAMLPVALPLRTLELHGTAVGDKHKLDWTIDADEQVVNQTLEMSTDGRTFSTVVTSPNNARSYLYTPATSVSTAYRLNVTFDNGRQYYSNIVNIPVVKDAVRPRIAGNLVNANSFNVTSPGNYTYKLIDLNGKQLAKGNLTSGNNIINANLLNGMYLVQFSNGTDVWTDKLIRQ